MFCGPRLGSEAFAVPFLATIWLPRLVGWFPIAKQTQFIVETEPGKTAGVGGIGPGDNADASVLHGPNNLKLLPKMRLRES